MCIHMSYVYIQTYTCICIYLPLAQPWVRGCWESTVVSATHTAIFSSADFGPGFVISKNGSSSQLICALRSGLTSRSSRSRIVSFNTGYLL